MIRSIGSFVLDGMTARPCRVEVSIATGQLMGTTVVGLPDAAVRESIERVRSAVRNSGYRWPEGWITINLAPARVRKEGPVYDLPIAVAVLAAGGIIETPTRIDLDQVVMAGELALDGSLRSIHGVTSLALLARRGSAIAVVPTEDATPAGVVPGASVLVAQSLSEVVGWLHGEDDLRPADPLPGPEIRDGDDFADAVRPKLPAAAVAAVAAEYAL